jgi:hypothetical protein
VTSQQISAKPVQLEFIPLHISTFEENGVWFARAEEFQVMHHGDSPTEATRNVYNMVLRAVFVAAAEGRLPAILQKAGVEIKIGFPDEEQDAAIPGQQRLWYVTLPQAA